eukprot:TRINITY_DN874_c0_g2_i16.p1 TRINITY_DN874_c0_g2~~TRINITY_DN874_c0_g2_i16.p1  ORF type:complete len:187 (+),score=20.25 TRINITY_DN874_c0_g2_i16:436-996(+)
MLTFRQGGNLLNLTREYAVAISSILLHDYPCTNFFSTSSSRGVVLVTDPHSLYTRDDGDWFLIDDGCNLHSSVTKEELEVLKLFKALLSRTTDIGHIANQVLTVGLPNEFRGMVWQLLLGYLPTDANQRNSVLKSQRQTYLTLVEAYCSSFCEDDTELHYLIGMDVLRTHPTCRFGCGGVNGSGGG